MKVCFETFGCRLNRAEALDLEARFVSRGWTTTERHDDADMIVVRCCSVTHRAQRDCERLVEHIRGKYPTKRVVVTGCTAEKLHEQWLADMRDAPSVVPTRTARAYLKVQDGCSGKCAFCIVPTFRGVARSVPFEDVLARASRFVEAGYHEIVVTGCNLSQYVSGTRRLPELVDALAALDPACRVRLGSLEPAPVAMDVVAAVAASKNACRYLHVPVQSGSDRVLTAMRRPYKRKDVERLVSEAAKLMPGLGLGCDIMTGFPDETPNDFLATKGLLERLPFTKVHVFPFSERPGTIAAGLPNAVPPEVRTDRAREVARWSEKARTDFIRRMKGRTVQIVVEDESTLSGWTSEYVWCQIGSEKAKTLARSHGGQDAKIRRKDLVSVLVREAVGHVLTGDPA
jgi:threonylcarbamoyladenosine tRNA methylthiotransferase MtaB